MEMDTLTQRKHAEEIFRHVLFTLGPEHLVKRVVQRHNSTLSVGQKAYNLDHYEHIYVVGGGKACAPMAKAIEDILGDRLDGGIIIVKYDHGLPLKKIKIVEASHPLPDMNGMVGTAEILKLLSKTGEKDLVLALISGGGSALLVQPHGDTTLEDSKTTSDELLACGAKIEEINAVRKHASMIKGGQLARAVSPSMLITLILSDVVGDPLDIIASGPTVPDGSTFQDAYEVIQKYSLENRIPDRVCDLLKRGVRGQIPENPKQGDKIFENTQNEIIGSNKIALEAAKDKAADLGYNTIILSSLVEGESREVAKFFAAIAKEVSRTGSPIGKPACIIAGGETTVTIRGDGKGGRNQEYALSAALEIDGEQGIVVLSGGTDGTDGPTDAAGAIVDVYTCSDAKAKFNLSPEDYLQRNDSYHFFHQLGQLLVTGPTLTNVMDLTIALII